MKTNREIIDRNAKHFNTALMNLEADKVMKEARIDTLEHLMEQFKVNQKKLSPVACIELINELIKDIKK